MSEVKSAWISPAWPSWCSQSLLRDGARQLTSDALKHACWRGSCAVMTPARLYQLLAKEWVTGWVTPKTGPTTPHHRHHLGRRIITDLSAQHMNPCPLWLCKLTGFSFYRLMLFDPGWVYKKDNFLELYLYTSRHFGVCFHTLGRAREEWQYLNLCGSKLSLSFETFEVWVTGLVAELQMRTRRNIYSLWTNTLLSKVSFYLDSLPIRASVRNPKPIGRMRRPTTPYQNVQELCLECPTKTLFSEFGS